MKRLGIVVALLALICTRARAQTPAQMEDAKKQFELGQVAYDLAKYDEALKYAPNWKQLKESRDAIVWKRS